MHLRAHGVTIFYLLGDDPAPSWGAGMIYEHVRLLRERGFDARVLHERSPFRPAWLEVDVPIVYRDDPQFVASSRDVVVVPEVLAADPYVARFAWRRVVFVQGSFLILRGLRGATDYRRLGYAAAMVTMPHMAQIVERHFGTEAFVVPPFVASYFAADDRPREKRILFASAKEGYRVAGIPDHEIAATLLQREISRRAEWSFVALENLTHRDVAELEKSSMFLVNVNSHEGFNATVAEAMAAGCIPVCYHATGGRDYLRDGENAIVFENQQVYPLVERVCELMDDPDAAMLDRIRAGMRETVKEYTPEKAAKALVEFFG